MDETSDAQRTYRYLRVGMLSAVVLLAGAVVLEGLDQDRWQTSISAYFYTPAHAAFVGVLLVIGFAMIVIKGRNTIEDIALNFAGMLAPIVALAPTSPPKVGDPARRKAFIPKDSAILDAVDNNIHALLATGVVCLGIGLVVAVYLNRSRLSTSVRGVDKDTWRTLGSSAIAVAVVIVAKVAWDDDFASKAHGNAARFMFGFMFVAAVFAALEARLKPAGRDKYFWWYAVTAAGMFCGLAVIPWDPFGRHEVFALEAWEILWFGIFWAVQTAERWNEEPDDRNLEVPVRQDLKRLLRQAKPKAA